MLFNNSAPPSTVSRIASAYHSVDKQRETTEPKSPRTSAFATRQSTLLSSDGWILKVLFFKVSLAVLNGLEPNVAAMAEFCM